MEEYTPEEKAMLKERFMLITQARKQLMHARRNREKIRQSLMRLLLVPGSNDRMTQLHTDVQQIEMHILNIVDGINRTSEEIKEIEELAEARVAAQARPSSPQLYNNPLWPQDDDAEYFNEYEETTYVD